MKKGFTLIEILIVIMVISVLFGILTPRFKGIRDEASIAKVKSELTVLQAAIESYYSTNLKYPESANTGSSCNGVNCAFPFTEVIGATPQIISQNLTDPFSTASPKEPYQYGLYGDTYLIFSRGVYGWAFARISTTSGAVYEGIPVGGSVSGTKEDCIYITNGPNPDTYP